MFFRGLHFLWNVDGSPVIFYCICDWDSQNPDPQMSRTKHFLYETWTSTERRSANFKYKYFSVHSMDVHRTQSRVVLLQAVHCMYQRRPQIPDQWMSSTNVLIYAEQFCKQCRAQMFKYHFVHYCSGPVLSVLILNLFFKQGTVSFVLPLNTSKVLLWFLSGFIIFSDFFLKWTSYSSH